MSQHLPYRDFKWKEVDGLNLEDCKEHSRKGIILEVDLEYPEELHDLHNDYPCVPEKSLVTDDMLSHCCSNIKNLHGNTSGNVQKLITSLNHKKKYVLHYRNLKLYQSLGLKCKKVHQVLEFSQRKWLKPYFDFNTKMRTKAKNSFEKDFFKLMNNRVFGKNYGKPKIKIEYRISNKKKKGFLN